MPQIALDTAAFEAASAAVRAAAAQVPVALGVPAGVVGDVRLGAALDDVARSWARQLATLGTSLDALAAALHGASALFADAEGVTTASLAAALR